ncbi:hypothetical protein BER2_1180 [plant metagenome]|uniref:Uncharacterized protein n=1 Tax=plant metagenome TaxID=1297885 RepID=A0A484R6P2_9ZZZZ
MKKLSKILIVSSATLLGAASVQAAGIGAATPGDAQLVAQVSTGAQQGTDSKGNNDYKPGGTGGPGGKPREEVRQERDAAQHKGMSQQGEQKYPAKTRDGVPPTPTTDQVKTERDHASQTGKPQGEQGYPAKKQ